MNARDLIGKTMAEVRYADSGPECGVLVIVFTDGTRLEADDGYSYGCVVTINGEDMGTTEA